MHRIDHETDRHTLAVHPLPGMGAAELRLLRPGETHHVQDVFDVMSAHSRFLRFHAPTPRLTTGTLSYLAAVEPHRHSAVVAIVDGRAVGLARWIRLRHEASTAELAASVGDAYQRRGLGRAMVAALAADAVRSGIRHFACVVHAENRPLRTALRGVGARSSVQDPTELVFPVAAVLAPKDRAEQAAVVLPCPRAVRRAGTHAGGPRRP